MNNHLVDYLLGCATGMLIGIPSGALFLLYLIGLYAERGKQ